MERKVKKRRGPYGKVKQQYELVRGVDYDLEPVPGGYFDISLDSDEFNCANYLQLVPGTSNDEKVKGASSKTKKQCTGRGTRTPDSKAGNSTISSFKLEGLVPAIFTPMKQDGEVDYDKIEPYCQHLVDHGISQIYVNGTTGEGFSLTLKERKKVVEKWIEVGRKGGRLRSIVVQVGALNLHDSLELTRHAKDVGADAIASVPPLFFKPTTIDMLVRYCQEITAAAPDLPFYYYHLPANTGVQLCMEDLLLAASTEIPSMVGLKFSAKDLVDLIGCVHVTAPNREDKKYNLIYGTDAQVMGSLVTGADGAIGSTFNFIANVFTRIFTKVAEGNFVEARKDQYRSQQTDKVMARYGKMFGSNVASRKATMPLIGLDLGPARSPLRGPTQEELKAYRKDLEKIGFFDWYE